MDNNGNAQELNNDDYKEVFGNKQVENRPVEKETRNPIKNLLRRFYKKNNKAVSEQNKEPVNTNKDIRETLQGQVNTHVKYDSNSLSGRAQVLTKEDERNVFGDRT